MKKITSLIVSLFALCYSASSQDAHFSQFFYAPLFVNPGNTGVFNGDVRAYTLYRMQWFTVTTPYKTMTVSLDAPIFKKRMKNKDFFSAGINFGNDNQGSVREKTNSYLVSFSFTKYLGGRQKHNISLGYQIGYVTKTAAISALTWDTQWDGQEYNSSLPSQEPGGGSAGFLDMSTGLVWNFNTDHLFRSALGFSFDHFTAPNYSIQGEKEHLYPKLGFQWLVNYKLSETSNTTLQPSVMVNQQGSSLLVDGGLNVKYILQNHSHYTNNFYDEAIYIGAFYRLQDAFFVTFRMDYAAFSGSIAYDINVSGLTPASHSVGGFEIMLAYRGIFGIHRESKKESQRFMN